MHVLNFFCFIGLLCEDGKSYKMMYSISYILLFQSR